MQQGTDVRGFMRKRSVAWTWNGDADPMALVQASFVPSPLGPTDVLIQNKAVAINPVDWKALLGWAPGWSPGHVPGVDAAGIVIAAGDETSIPIGTRVAYHQSLQRQGSFATHTVVRESALLPIPDEVSFAVAATVPCPGITAWQALQKLPRLLERDVLIIGGGANTGLFLVQLAWKRGFYVWTTADPRHHAQLLAVGACGAFDYHKPNWQADLQRHLEDRRLYAAIDTVNEQHARALAPLIGYNGHLICIQDRLSTPPEPPFTTALSQHEVALASIHQHGLHWDWLDYQEAGSTLLHGIATGDLVAPSIQHFSFDQLPEALASLKLGCNHGKLIAEL